MRSRSHICACILYGARRSVTAWQYCFNRRPTVFRNMTPCNFVEGNQCFGEKYLPVQVRQMETVFLRNVTTYAHTQNDMVSHPTKQIMKITTTSHNHNACISTLNINRDPCSSNHPKDPRAPLPPLFRI